MDEHVSLDRSMPEKSAGLAQSLKGLTYDEFSVLLRGMLASLLRCLQGVDAQGKIIIEITESFT